jgi:hypothetical protein
MLPIQLVGDLASTGAQIAFPPAGVIFSAVKYLINAAGGVSAKYDAIVELMGTLKVRLESSLNLLSVYLFHGRFRISPSGWVFMASS